MDFQKTFDAVIKETGVNCSIETHQLTQVWKPGPSILGKAGLQASAQYSEFSKNTCSVLSSCQKSKSSAKVSHQTNREKWRAFLCCYDHDLPTLELRHLSLLSKRENSKGQRGKSMKQLMSEEQKGLFSLEKWCRGQQRRWMKYRWLRSQSNMVWESWREFWIINQPFQ